MNTKKDQQLGEEEKIRKRRKIKRYIITRRRTMKRGES